MEKKYWGVLLFLCIALVFLASCQSRETANHNSVNPTKDTGKTQQEGSASTGGDGQNSTVKEEEGQPSQETSKDGTETAGTESRSDSGQTNTEQTNAGQTSTQGGSSSQATQGQSTKPTGTATANTTATAAPTVSASTAPPDLQGDLNAKVQYYLNTMTIEEKICQMFIVHPEKLVNNAKAYTSAGETTRQAINRYPVGGVVYFADNIQSGAQVKEMLANTQKYSMERIGLPAFLCVDEEGGKVARIAGSGKFSVPVFDNMSVIGAAGDVNQAYHVGDTIGNYLAELGFNVDFAPVADVLSNPGNTVVKLRSFGSNPQLVANMALAVSRGLNQHGVSSAFKHFPGHGATEGDTHEGYAYTSKTLEELQTCELIPFQKAVDANAEFIMVAHISLPAVIGDNTPASLSEKMIRQILRQKMGYDGIVITDAMGMGAIAKNYDAKEATVKAVEAGVDIVLMPSSLEQSYTALLDAVKSGRISEQRINESVARILRVKLKKM